MNIDSSSFFFGAFYKFNDLVEAAFDVFSNVVFQMEWEVLHSFFYMIISTVVSCTINNMSDTVLSKLIVILGNNVWT